MVNERHSQSAKAMWQRPSYRAKHRFPIVARHTEETREKMRKSAPKSKSSIHRTNIAKALTGKKKSPEHIENNRQGQLGKTLSPETRERIRKSMRKRWENPEYRERICLSIQGKKHSPEAQERHRQARLRQKFPCKMTSLERALEAEFEKLGLDFEMHKPMFGRFQPDFIFQGAKLIVEADGEYWHRNKDHQPLYKAAEKEGWEVWRFSGATIKESAKTCAQVVSFFIAR